MTDLFEHTANQYYKKNAPLAERMRPQELSKFLGQKKLFEKGSPLSIVMEGGKLLNVILWGPPGTGKTTLAQILSLKSGLYFQSLSAVHSGKKDLVECISKAKERTQLYGQGTVLFIDEIHRYNKAQQDGLLGGMEKGYFSLIGATTENPSFELNNALLSRCQVMVLSSLSSSDLEEMIHQALKDEENGLGKTGMNISPAAVDKTIRLARGDGRSALNYLELGALACSERYGGVQQKKKKRTIEEIDIGRGIEKRMLLYDKTGDEHYQLASALIKSIRGSDPDSGLYYLARMIRGGEDLKFIARRLVILASEDIGNADPQAAILASSVFSTVERVGMPEARIPLGQLVTYLALAPKSNASYVAIDKALSLVDKTGALPVPQKIINAPTSMMKDMGYGKGYHYAHQYVGGFYPESFLPDEIKDEQIYSPSEQGAEKELKARLQNLKEQIKNRSEAK